MKSVTRVVFAMTIMWFSSCRPLPPKPLDISSPEALAEELLETLVDQDEQEFITALLVKPEALEVLVAKLEETGTVSINPKFVEEREAEVERLTVLWEKLRLQAQLEGVLWEAVEYHGCRFKISQHPDQLPVSLSFQIFFEVGGYFYQIDISSIMYEENYYIFDDLKWVGEVEQPKHVVK